MTKGKVPPDPRGGHVRLYWDIYDSPAFRALSWFDQALWLAMRRKLGKTNNGNIEATLGGTGGLRHYGIKSPASLSKGLRALQAAGLIAKTRQGHLSQGRRTCSLYRFTDEEVFAQRAGSFEIRSVKATHEWRQFSNLASAEAAIRKAHQAAKTGRQRVSKNAASVRLLNDVDTNHEVMRQSAGSADEVGTATSIRRLKMVKVG